MGNVHVFEHLDYRDFLRQHFPPKGEGRGRRSALAKSLGCEISFVSLVLNKHAHFTGEHVFATAEFLGLTTGEIEFLLLLFSWNRAGSKKLEAYYRRAIDTILAERGKIKNRIESRQTIDLEKQLEYYSHWAYTAVHMCLLNPKINSAIQIAEYLGLSMAQTNRILEFFFNTGLAVQEPGKDGAAIRSGPVRIHIPADSPLVGKHHANWRLRALESIASPLEGDLHYSLVLSLSNKDIEKIRNVLLDAIQQTESVIKETGDEAVYHLSMDLFEVGARKPAPSEYRRR